MMRILLLGNPNSGKTTLFNALTGENQRIGNWPGVTVEKKSGFFSMGDNEQNDELVDLPGVYSLNGSLESAQDEWITAQAVAQQASYDMIINVVDAANLERHLYLTSQLLELRRPMIVVVNMMDVATQRGITLDLPRLAQALGCPVIAVQAHKKLGIDTLKTAVGQVQSAPPGFFLPFSSALAQTIAKMTQVLQANHDAGSDRAYYTVLRYIEGSDGLLDAALRQQLDDLVAQTVDIDILAADARYQAIHNIVTAVQKKRHDASEHFTARLDRIVLNRFLALPIFLAAMYAMFLFAINIGGAFQDFFDLSTETIFVHGTAWALSQLHAPFWLIALLANGVGKGMNTTLTFIPVISAMFFFLSLLEQSGYMARAAFVVDKIMRKLGLPGQSFVPMIVGFGCNVPAIMAARTLDSERDRLLTVLMSPFMSCSARLAIYAVFVAAFFPTGGQNIVFALYLIGILMAVFTGYILRRSVFQGQASTLILELPAYHHPSWRRLFSETLRRLRYFILRASRMIIPVCVLLGVLNTLTATGHFSGASANTQSWLSIVGQWLTPVFTPMGIHMNNWPATVGLLSGMLAKEVVIGTLNTLYTSIGHLDSASIGQFHFWSEMSQALASIPNNLANLGGALKNPLLASVPDNDMSKSVYGIMAAYFDGKSGAFAYLLFILLYIPCVSTMAAIRQEANVRLMWFSIIWSFLLAYVMAVGFYQAATFFEHPMASLSWLISLGGLLIGFVRIMIHYRLFNREQHVIANSSLHEARKNCQ